MKNLLEYNEWLRATYAIWKGVRCEIVSRNADEVVLKTPTETITLSINDPDLKPVNDEDTLIPFLQISAPTIAY
jgi:hypothetical protein